MDLRLVWPATAMWAVSLAATVGLDLNVLSAKAVAVVGYILFVLGVILTVRLVVRQLRRDLDFRQSPTANRDRAARTHAWQGATALVFCALLGFTCVHTAVREQLRHPDWLAVSSSASVDAEFTISGEPTIRESAYGTTAMVAATLQAVQPRSSTDKQGLRRLNAPVLVFATEQQLSGLSIGGRMRASVKLVPSDTGGRVAYLATLTSDPSEVDPPGQPLASINALREDFRSRMSALPGDGADLLPGLSLGDTSLVSESVDAAMKTSSLSHLTAVSGSNCAVIVTIFLVTARRLGLQRVARLGAVILGLLGFVLLVTPDASVLRAAVMSVVIMIAKTSGRPGRGLSSLCVAIIILLGCDPRISGDYGFVLSVLATASILVLAPKLTLLLERWMPSFIAQVIAIPTAAQISCQPVLLLLQPVIPLAGVLANVLAAPAAPMATVAGLAACLLMPVVPGLAMLVAETATWPSSWIVQVAKVTSELRWAQFDWPQGFWGFGLLVFGVLCVVVAVFRHGAPKSIPAVRATAVVASLCALLLGSTLGASNSGRWHSSLTRPQNWDFALCDIGQGDATLVRSGSHTILIDTGPSIEALSSCLHLLGVSRIDLLVLTHYDFDHVGAVEAVLTQTDRALVAPVLEPSDQTTRRLLGSAGIEVTEAQAGLSGAFGAGTWQVIWPVAVSSHSKDDAAGADTKSFVGERDGNAQSVTLDVRTPTGRGIFLGDLGERSQARLLSRFDPAAGPPIDFVKVAHHGSRDQSALLYKKLAASYAGISVGEANSYGHPTTAALDLMSVSGSAVLRTDEMGTIVLSQHERTGERGAGRWSIWQSSPVVAAMNDAGAGAVVDSGASSVAETVNGAAADVEAREAASGVASWVPAKVLASAPTFGDPTVPNERRGRGRGVGKIRGWQWQRVGQSPKAKRM